MTGYVSRTLCEGVVRELAGWLPEGYDLGWLTDQVAVCDPGRGWRVISVDGARWEALVAESDRRQSPAVRRAMELG